MIDAIVRTSYRLICDQCGNVAPETRVKEEARLIAGDAGWSHLVQWNGQEYVHTDLCPSCHRKEE